MHSTRLIVGVGVTLAVSRPAWGGVPGGVEVADTLAMSLAWITLYLGVGVTLVAITTALGVREHRAWSNLLRWDVGDEGGGRSEKEREGTPADGPPPAHGA